MTRFVPFGSFVRVAMTNFSNNKDVEGWFSEFGHASIPLSVVLLVYIYQRTFGHVAKRRPRLNTHTIVSAHISPLFKHILTHKMSSTQHVAGGLEGLALGAPVSQSLSRLSFIHFSAKSFIVRSRYTLPLNI